MVVVQNNAGHPWVLPAGDGSLRLTPGTNELTAAEWAAVKLTAETIPDIVVLR